MVGFQLEPLSYRGRHTVQHCKYFAQCCPPTTTTLKLLCAVVQSYALHLVSGDARVKLRRMF